MEEYDDPSRLLRLSSTFSPSISQSPNTGQTAPGAKQIVFDELELGNTIGEGSFGYVRVARWRGMGVAVKLLKHSKSDHHKDSREREKFVQELRNEVTTMTRVCNHAYVIQLVGVVYDPVPCIVTNYYDYGSLEDLLVKDKRGIRDSIEYRKLLQFSIECCLGVRHLHMEGVIHRDLAARNLLLDQNFHVRVSDFGFSRLKENGASKGYTDSGVGPIRWTAPEAMRKRMFSEASDVFSLGVVLYEIFAQCIPWKDCETIDVAVRVCSGERMDVPLTLPTAIRDIMQACWSQDPFSRPPLPDIVSTLEMEMSLAPIPAGNVLTTAGAHTRGMISQNEHRYEEFTTIPTEWSANTDGGLWSSCSCESGVTENDSVLTEGMSGLLMCVPAKHNADEGPSGEYVNPVLTSLWTTNSKSEAVDSPSTEISAPASFLLQRDVSKFSDAQFLGCFHSRQLRSWGHESLLRLIYLLLQQKGRSSKTVAHIIKTMQDFQKSDFHMTTTYFWIQMITYAIEICKQNVLMAVFDVDNSDARLLQLTFMEFILQPHCAQLRDSQLFLKYYSQEVIDSGYVDFRLPDLRQLPSTLNLPTKKSQSSMHT